MHKTLPCFDLPPWAPSSDNREHSVQNRPTLLLKISHSQIHVYLYLIWRNVVTTVKPPLSGLLTNGHLLLWDTILGNTMLIPCSWLVCVRPHKVNFMFLVSVCVQSVPVTCVTCVFSMQPQCLHSLHPVASPSSQSFGFSKYVKCLLFALMLTFECNMYTHNLYSSSSSSFSSSSPPSSPSFTEAVVLFEYEKQEEDELTLKVGEVILNVKQVGREPQSCSSY